MLQLTICSGQGGWGSGRQLTIPGEHTQKSVGERQSFLNITCRFSLQTLWKNSGWPETGLPFTGYAFSGTYDQVIPEIPREAIVEKTFYSFRQTVSSDSVFPLASFSLWTMPAGAGIPFSSAGWREGPQMVILLLNFHANTEHKESLEKPLAVPAGHFCISYLGRDGRKGRVTNWKFSLFCKVRSCNFPNGIQALQLFQFCLKIEVRFGGGMFRILSSFKDTCTGW